MAPEEALGEVLQVCQIPYVLSFSFLFHVGLIQMMLCLCVPFLPPSPGFLDFLISYC